MTTVAFDTSNYTSSMASYDGHCLHNVSRLLDVRPGELGLRQSDALFSHIKNLPEISKELFGQKLPSIDCVGVSTRPRNLEGSYMPCFLAGVSSAAVLAEALDVPLFEFSHQEGHIAAVLFSSGRTDLRDSPFLAWHLSGGTTELLHVCPEGKHFSCRKIGGTTDISAGQIIDRTGKHLMLPFPSGKAIDSLAAASDCRKFFKIKNDGCYFSVSGLENKMLDFSESASGPEDTARYVLHSLTDLIQRVTAQALKDYPGSYVIFSGGVSSNSLLRKEMAEYPAVFGEAKYSTDNAGGIAVLSKWMMD